MANIETKEVKLKDGRTVVVRELTGADEMLALKLVSKELSFNEKEIAAGMMQQQNVMVALSVLKVGDEPKMPPTSFQAVLEFMKSFKMSDWNKIRAAFNELNGADEDFTDAPMN